VCVCVCVRVCVCVCVCVQTLFLLMPSIVKEDEVQLQGLPISLLFQTVSQPLSLFSLL
jgi:hypothetical protein